VQVAAAQQEPNVRHGSVVAKPNQRYGVVVGRFNDLVTKLLLEGAKGAFAAHGVEMSNVEVRDSQAVGSACARAIIFNLKASHES
jgi:6,7-dimethyl-8-ribityllumazine synthase